MKHVFTATTLIEGANIAMLKALLEQVGIDCMIRNDFLSSAMGEMPFLESSPQLWIQNDEDYLKARELLESWQTAKIEVGDDWSCVDCGEMIEGQFTSCWQCGREADRAT